MPSFINYIKIDFYKFYHSKIIKVHFIIPVLAMIPFLSYYSVSPWNELDKVISYIQIISMSFPLIISIILNMVYEQEECGGSKKLFCPCGRRPDRPLRQAWQQVRGDGNRRTPPHFP